LSSVAGFFATWFIANQLGSVILGEYSVIVALLFWLNIPASAIGAAVNKRSSEEGDIEPYVAAGHALNGVVSMGLISGILLLSAEINELANGRNVSLLVAGLVLAQSFFDITIESLRGNMQVGASGLLKTFERIVRSTTQIGIIVASLGFIWLVIGHTTSLLVATTLGVVLLRKKPSVPSRRHFTDLLDYAKYSWLGTMKTRAFGWMDTIVLAIFATSGFGALVSHGQIGIYEVAWSLASTLGLISVSINQTLFPEVSGLSAEENFSRVRNLLSDGIAFTGMFAIPGVVGAIILGGDLLSVYRPEFARGKWILVILIIARLFASYNTQFINVLNAIDRPDIAFRINIMFLISNLFLNFGLVYYYGWYGAAVATMLTGALGLIVSWIFIERTVGEISYPIREVITQVVSACAMGVVIIGAQSAVRQSTMSVILLVLSGAAVYGMVLFSLSKTFRRKITTLR